MKPQIINLLLADDDPDDCMFFSEILNELPVSATLKTVNDGEELMKTLLDKEDNLPDILFLDLNMPRKTGFECLKEIKQNKRLEMIPVVIFSTSSDKSIVDLLYDLGAHYYIRKPAVFAQLKRVIYIALTIITINNFLKPSKENFVILD